MRATARPPISILQARGGGAIPEVALSTIDRFVRLLSQPLVELPFSCVRKLQETTRPPIDPTLSLTPRPETVPAPRGRPGRACLLVGLYKMSLRGLTYRGVGTLLYGFTVYRKVLKVTVK